jgi:hypothetical protein
MKSRDNWFLMDDVHPKWTTTTLLDACQRYLKARKLCQGQGAILTSAKNASILQAGTDFANIIVPPILNSARA